MWPVERVSVGWGRQSGGAASRAGPGNHGCWAAFWKRSNLSQRSAWAGEVAARLAGLGMVKCLAFSTNGRLLALGGDDGAITVLDWPSLHARADLRCDSH